MERGIRRRRSEHVPCHDPALWYRDTEVTQVPLTSHSASLEEASNSSISPWGHGVSEKKDIGSTLLGCCCGAMKTPESTLHQNERPFQIPVFAARLDAISSYIQITAGQ